MGAPIPGVQLASYRGVPPRRLRLREISTEESDSPALCKRTAVPGTVDEALRDLLGNAWAFGGWASRWWGMAEPGQPLGAIGGEPGADSVLVAVSPLSHGGNTPALRIA